MFQVYVLNVFSISDVCGNVFYLNVAKVDLDVAYIYMQVLQVFSYVCCRVSSRCFAYVCNGYTCFQVFSGASQVSQIYVISVLLF
jgi:hypothetical protein